MDKGKVLVLGCGGCGCNQLDILMGLDRRYTGMFVNTNLAEMEDLEHFDIDRRCFYIANADGTGKNRDLAEQYMKEEAPKFIEKIKRFVNQTYVVMLASANGGTGSKAIMMLSRLIKNVCPEKSVNIAVTFPSVNESDIDYENAIDFWNELIGLKKKGIIDSIQFIDNNKSSNEEEINLRAMKELDESLSFATGKLDNSDLERVHTTEGYKVFLKLDNSKTNLKDAINESIKQSMFYVPDNLDCDAIVGNINTSTLRSEDIEKELEVYGFSKFNENREEKTSVLLLGGCETPKETIDLIKEALKESKNRRRKRVVEEEELIVKRSDKKDENEVETKYATQKSSRLTSKDLNDMFADDSFWN